MKARDPWVLLRSGQTQKGLKQMRQAHDRDPTPSHIMELGVAYLWLREYEAAWKHFSLAIESYPRSISSFYGMAGAAKWCLEEPRDAVRQWWAGLECRFTDTNGLGIQLPLLLFVASVLKPGTVESAAVEKILRAKVKDRRANEWPGPIAQRILGEITVEELRSRFAGDVDSETQDMHWLTDFYQGILWYRDGENVKFKETMRKLVDTTRREWSDHDFFLARMWSEEFFLARREAS